MSKKKPKPPTDWCDVVSCDCGNKAKLPFPEPTQLELEERQSAYKYGYLRGTIETEERISKLLEDDEVMHNIWWCIKREDSFPSAGFIADVIREFLLIKGEQK